MSSHDISSSLPFLLHRHIHQENSKTHFSIKRDGPVPPSTEGSDQPLTVSGNGEGHKPKNVRTLLLVAVAAGILGFAAARSDIYGSLVKATAAYGSPEDFKKAIRELQDTFGAEEDEAGDIVSTNPDVLHAHGFSTLVYHEGKARISSMIGRNRNNADAKM